ncbi:DUF4065 domain-containing protein [Staphylococcus pseudintermedius]|uniref:Panacea domain-containing protein n=1 Tax=Staphylococcus TaxID=1279 RepID=UPI0015D53F3D|nr:type II toxin-antitoxin system antitoxin SocA domain-containing protein [Staphylococcus pseudintermedius]EGQ3078348.1 DUF4065 domain-containing protein [Staphylococcus pseudintermedius]EGQ3251264.1 DUF4065 domain-containing protein [Staphylococcus pseudintermedius]EGQ3487565.1 DUF4065 domain-containing protein [Staphylococcus pseudintermedius]EGQ3788188.1 DUF4065 domain-containing protein [Staphylococcus pseudintermedius]EHD7788279.1 DUF4065 domain-containing protein [Staphylococcus pseudin
MIGLEKHILSIATDIDKPITNLQLQKIWYFTLGFLIKKGDIELAKSEFENSNLEAWLYGPVVPRFYNEYKEYKSMPIQDKGRKIDEFNNDTINNFIKRLIKINPFTLVDISHQHAFWADNKNEIESLGYKPSYGFKDIEEAFK